MHGRRQLSPVGAPSLTLRAARFEDVPRLLELIEAAIEYGCREHYDGAQRRAVYLAYASNFFVDVLGPFEALIAEIDGRLAGVAQLDVAAGVVRALFVDADIQGQGLGRALLAAVEARARTAGRSHIRGAMSLNAVSFYAREGFRRCNGPTRLLSAGVEVPVVWMEKSLRT